MAVMINLPFGRGRLFAGDPGTGRCRDWAAEIGATSWAQVFLKYIVSPPGAADRDPGHGAGPLRRRQSRRGAGPAARRGDADAGWSSLSMPSEAARGRRAAGSAALIVAEPARDARRARRLRCSSSCSSPPISCCGRCARRSASPAASTICSGCSPAPSSRLWWSCPLYGWLAARVPRRRLLPVTYVVVGAGDGRLRLQPAQPIPDNVWTARAFYIWLSVFNLFVDLDRLEPDGRRVRRRAGPPPVRPDRRRRQPRRARRAAAQRPCWSRRSAMPGCCSSRPSCCCSTLPFARVAARLARRATAGPTTPARPTSGSAARSGPGLDLILRSPYLLGIALFVHAADLGHHLPLFRAGADRRGDLPRPHRARPRCSARSTRPSRR